MNEPDPRQTLVQLGCVSPEDLQDSDEHSSALARAINTPLRRLGVTDLYLLIRANLALAAVIPLAQERLLDSPYLQAAEFPGDLLTTLLESDARYWLGNQGAWEEMLPIVALAMEQAQTTDDNGEVTYAIGDGLAAAVLHFMGHHKVGQ